MSGHNRILPPSYARLSSTTSVERQYGHSRYRTMRRLYLTQHPLCERCGRLSEELHHRTKTTLGGAVKDYANFEALCRPCHREADR